MRKCIRKNKIREAIFESTERQERQNVLEAWFRCLLVMLCVRSSYEHHGYANGTEMELYTICLVSTLESRSHCCEMQMRIYLYLPYNASMNEQVFVRQFNLKANTKGKTRKITFKISQFTTVLRICHLLGK